MKVNLNFTSDWNECVNRIETIVHTLPPGVFDDTTKAALAPEVDTLHNLFKQHDMLMIGELLRTHIVFPPSYLCVAIELLDYDMLVVCLGLDGGESKGPMVEELVRRLYNYTPPKEMAKQYEDRWWLVWDFAAPSLILKVMTEEYDKTGKIPDVNFGSICLDFPRYFCSDEWVELTTRFPSLRGVAYPVSE